MTWSYARSRQAAAEIRAAPLGRRAAAAARPRSVLGIVRSRAPLPVLLYVAARDGRLVEQDGGGLAVLSRPLASRPPRPGRYGLRLLRWLDRCWDLAVFAGPPALGLGLAVVTALVPATRLVAVAAALGALGWVAVFLTAMLGYQLRWLGQLGAARPAGRSRAAESLPGYHWSVPLLHQPDPDRADALLRLVTEQLVRLIRADLQAAGGDQVRVGHPDVTETAVILVSGITSQPSADAVAGSLRAISGYRAGGDVVVLSAPARLEQVRPRPVAGGGFALLYAAGLAVVVAVSASLVASREAQACGTGSCAGRPATYAAALRWLLQRLLFSDPPGLSPGTALAAVLGWLVSAASAMLVVVVIVAARQEIALNLRAGADHAEAMRSVLGTARVLILVVTEGERDAVLAAVRDRTGREAVISHLGERSVYTLGLLAGQELMLAQAGEQGSASAAAMLLTADDAIRECRPDYVVATGICFGLRPEAGQQAGDIIVARRVQNVDHVKVTDDPEHPVSYRGVSVGCSPRLLDRFQAGQVTWDGASVQVGNVLASNTLANSRRLVSRLRADFPDALAGEMEGSAVHEAAARAAVKPDWILVKAISDWGFSKTGHDQARAAANAAAFVVHVLACGALRALRA